MRPAIILLAFAATLTAAPVTNHLGKIIRADGATDSEKLVNLRLQALVNARRELRLARTNQFNTVAITNLVERVNQKGRTNLVEEVVKIRIPK
jgi:hypothetical protein